MRFLIFIWIDISTRNALWSHASFFLKNQITHLFHFCSYVVFKSLAGMQWDSENLTNETLYSNGDNDVLVNLTKLHNLIDEKKTHFTKTMTFPIICVYGGRVNDHPVRNPKSKYYISKKQYAKDSWPWFCLGGFYTTNVAKVSQFYAKSKTEPYLAMENVWITGILRIKLNISDDAIVFHNVGGIAIHKHGKLIISK